MDLHMCSSTFKELPIVAILMASPESCWTQYDPGKVGKASYMVLMRNCCLVGTAPRIHHDRDM